MFQGILGETSHFVPMMLEGLWKNNNHHHTLLYMCMRGLQLEVMLFWASQNLGRRTIFDLWYGYHNAGTNGKQKLGTIVTPGEEHGAGQVLIYFPATFGLSALMEGICAHDECWEIYWQHLQIGPQLFWSSFMWKSNSGRKGGMRRSQLNQTEAL